MSFCTVINCMDGRIQIPVINFLQEYFNAENVDNITEPGPNLVLSENKEDIKIDSILKRLKISVVNHKSTGIAVVGHYDCAGNPSEYEDQIEHIKNSIKFLKEHYAELEVIGLWVNKDWEVELVSP